MWLCVSRHQMNMQEVKKEEEEELNDSGVADLQAGLSSPGAAWKGGQRSGKAGGCFGREGKHVSLPWRPSPAFPLCAAHIAFCICCTLCTPFSCWYRHKECCHCTCNRTYMGLQSTSDQHLGRGLRMALQEFQGCSHTQAMAVSIAKHAHLTFELQENLQVLTQLLCMLTRGSFSKRSGLQLSMQ